MNWRVVCVTHCCQVGEGRPPWGGDIYTETSEGQEGTSQMKSRMRAVHGYGREDAKACSSKDVGFLKEIEGGTCLAISG